MSSMQEYWKKNQRLIAVLLTIWALVSYGFAIFARAPAVRHPRWARSR